MNTVTIQINETMTRTYNGNPVDTLQSLKHRVKVMRRAWKKSNPLNETETKESFKEWRASVRELQLYKSAIRKLNKQT